MYIPTWLAISINNSLQYYTLSLLKNFTLIFLNVKPSSLLYLKTCDTEFDEFIVTFTDQNGRPLEIEDKVSLTLLINK